MNMPPMLRRDFDRINAEALKPYMEGKIEIDPLITHTLPLADINRGFELMHQGESIRSVIVY